MSNIPLLKVTEVNDEIIAGIWLPENKIIYLDPRKIPIILDVGDVFYHIEHKYCDIYDKNNNFKLGLIKIIDLFIKP